MYGLFLDTVNVMNSIDSAFLLFKDDVVKKIENIIVSVIERLNIIE